MIQENFVKLYESGFKENWDMPVFTRSEERRVGKEC